MAPLPRAPDRRCLHLRDTLSPSICVCSLQKKALRYSTVLAAGRTLQALDMLRLGTMHILHHDDLRPDHADHPSAIAWR